MYNTYIYIFDNIEDHRWNPWVGTTATRHPLWQKKIMQMNGPRRFGGAANDANHGKKLKKKAGKNWREKQ